MQWKQMAKNVSGKGKLKSTINKIIIMNNLFEM